MEFKKNILSARKYFSPDGEVDVTPERLQHWSKTFKDMTEAGHRIPVAWDHEQDVSKAVPVKARSGSKSASENVGFLKSFELAEDGESADIILDLPKHKDEDEANLASVSPVIFQKWTDGEKKDWDDCITHVDLVRHPVDNTQTPFVACALRMGLDDRIEDYSAQRMGDSPEGESQANGVPVKPSTLDSVITRLKEIGVVLPEGTDANNFFDRFDAALATRVAMEEDEMDEEKTVVAQMGLEKEGESKEPAAPSPEQLWVRKQHHQSVGQRLSTLLENGQITPKEYEDHSKEVPALRLSLDSDGNHQPTNLETWIEAREACPRGSFWSAEEQTRMSLDTPAKQPGHVTGEETEEVVEENLKFVYGDNA